MFKPCRIWLAFVGPASEPNPANPFADVVTPAAYWRASAIVSLSTARRSATSASRAARAKLLPMSSARRRSWAEVTMVPPIFTSPPEA
ncbi:hypothetical protein Aple_025310 [Acrocarpospora pleiomorpha]|uniref:Uncharacterized protein n=1 Tax=Acrocarpospora pleiomorpha TaxID=90975 RepID=A0A5M3XDC6_9ACTN|nr:hypothetical protein [Acrocarpospora pleiomorpha]GES19635.1 hypothetical protein Aple_025310 [Acrocarpospora pleiomorpha]